jgi:HEPN domain-containing protein
MSSRSQQFYRVGVQRLDTARRLSEELQIYLDARYLAGYAAECALKSLLFARTPPKQHRALEEEFKASGKGHNIEWLLEQLVRRVGENIPSDIRRLVGRVRSRWDVDLRYAAGRGSFVETSELIGFCDKLLQWSKGRIQ